MGRARQTVVAVAICGWFLGSATALADPPWVVFADETAARMNPSIPTGDEFGKHDTEEKDYAWGDVDQDGDIDLVVVRKVIGSNSGGKRNRLFMNENGVLVDRTDDYATAVVDNHPDSPPNGQGFNDLTPDRDVALVDVDSDGWLDIVTASAGAYSGLPKTISHPRIYMNLQNDAGGNWLGFRYEEARIPQLVEEPNFCGIAFGDVDGPIANNGPPDLYFADYFNNLEDRLLINDGSGNFTDLTTTRFPDEVDPCPSTGACPVCPECFLDATFAPHALMADLNGDGYNDIVQLSTLAGDYNMWAGYNNPGNPGVFTIGNIEIIFFGSTYFVAADDLNNDGMLDIIGAGGNADRWLRNTGNGPDGRADFVTAVFPDTIGLGSNVAIADLDKDGFKDVLIADVDVNNWSCVANRLRILHNLGDPPVVSFAEDTGNLPTTTPGGALTATHDVAVFDLDGDTWLDLVIGTCYGTTVWINQQGLHLAFAYPSGLPNHAALDGTTEIQLQLSPTGDTLDPTSPTMHLSINGGAFSPIPMTDLGSNLYSVNLPAAQCLDHLNFYFSAQVSGGQSFTDPLVAPASTYFAVAAESSTLAVVDEIEGDVSGWTITSDPSLTSGEWEQADPNGTNLPFGPGTVAAAPEDDATPAPGVMAFVTENGPPGGEPGANDVDGGPTYLVSPTIDLDGSDAIISYARWFFSEFVGDDLLTIEVSNDGGSNWVLVENIADTASAWETASFAVGDFVTPTANVKVRFSTADLTLLSYTEAGIDDFKVEKFLCALPCPSDINGDGTVNVLDLIDLLLCFGLPANPPCDTPDVNGDGTVNVLDLIDLLLAFGNACP